VDPGRKEDPWLDRSIIHHNLLNPS
jgi:hypothetical protein